MTMSPISASIQLGYKSMLSHKLLWAKGLSVMSNILSQAHNLVHRLELIARIAVLMGSSNMTEQL